MNHAMMQFFHRSQAALNIAKQDMALALWFMDIYIERPDVNAVRNAIHHVMKESGGSADPNRIRAMAEKLIAGEKP